MGLKGTRAYVCVFHCKLEFGDLVEVVLESFFSLGWEIEKRERRLQNIRFSNKKFDDH